MTANEIKNRIMEQAATRYTEMVCARIFCEEHEETVALYKFTEAADLLRLLFGTEAQEIKDYACSKYGAEFSKAQEMADAGQSFAQWNECPMMLGLGDLEDQITSPRHTNDSLIAQAREAARLTQDQLGDLLGVSAQMVGKWERGERNPKIETLQRIAKVLNVSVDNLLRQ